MKYIEDIKNDIDDLILSFIKKSERVTAEDLGLDSTAGSALYVFPDGIGVTNKGTKALENFGGFDTVDKDDIVSYGNYTFYLATSEKVNECLEHYSGDFESSQDEEMEDEEEIKETYHDEEEDNEDEYPHDMREEDEYYDDEDEYEEDEEEDDDIDFDEEDEDELREIIREELKELLREGKSDYEIYHDTYTSAVETALEYARSKGYEVDDDDVEEQITFSSGKPKNGQTLKHSIGLYKNSKLQNKYLHFQVYNMGKPTGKTFELNLYIS